MARAAWVLITLWRLAYYNMNHRNGGAHLKGDSHVSHNSYCDAHSVIDRSIVHSSTVCNSLVIDSQVSQSTIIDTKIEKSFIAEAGLNNCLLEDCIVTSFDGKPQLQMVRLVGVIVEGDTKLIGPWELEGNARIPCGEWKRAPRFCRITGNGVDIGLTESTNGYAMMACWRHPIDKWLKAGPRLGRHYRWTEDQIQKAYEFYESLRN